MSNPRHSVLITGCSPGGIGFALAKEFHSQGLLVFATARRLEVLSDLADLGITTLALDVTDVATIRKVQDHVATVTGGKLDVLVNNAGQDYPVAFTDADITAIRNLYEVNLFAPMAMVQEFVQLLIASGDGRIVQVGSILGIMPAPFSTAYSGTKAALHAFSNSLRVELAPFNIKVINVTAGAVATNFLHPRDFPETSLYKSMEHLYRKNRMEDVKVGATTPDAFAQVVVPQILAAVPRAWVWAGGNAFLTWFVDTFLPRTTWDYVMRKDFGFGEFAKMVADGKAKSD